QFKTIPLIPYFSNFAEALHHTLQIVSALHDIIYYLVSFSRLGNADNSCSCIGRGAPDSHLTADWGGSEGIGAELLKIQHQVDRLSNPSSPEFVGRLLQLRRQVLLLQFDTAVRHLIREAFLSSGDAAAFQSVSDNMATALPLLSDSIQTDVFSLTLPVPQPLEAQSCQAQMMYPWRSFIGCHGLLPLHVWDVPPIEYCMQLCLSGLSDRSRLQANAAILGVSLLMEDVLNSGREAEPVRLHGNKDDLLHDGKPNEVKGFFISYQKALLIQVQSVLKGFLLLMKQLQVFKESWARRRLGVEVSCTDEIFYPSMKSLAQQMGKERDYEILVYGTQSLLPPPGAAEVDVKTWQLHKLLESTECDMIRMVQRRINRELTLVVSERTRQDTHLPTELWKKVPLKYSLSPERPQIVETFIQQLMDGVEELRVSQGHLQQCLTHLGSSLMERECCCFLLYSQFYERILQQETQLLYQREQVHVLDCHLNRQPSSTCYWQFMYNKVSVLCRGMMLEISALQAQVAHLEEERTSLEEQFSLKFKERYDLLVRQLFSTCIQLKARLDEYHRQMERDVSEIVNRTREEGVDRIIKLKKKYGCTKDDNSLALTLVHELSQENSWLTALLCKLKAWNRWRLVVDDTTFCFAQREITSRTEALRVKMIAEEEVLFLQEELDVARQVLTRCQAECSSTKKKKKVLHSTSAQEARSRQELDTYRVQSLEQMRADMEDRERQLQVLSEQLDRGSRMNQLERQRSAREIRQVRGRLHQEHCLKQEAFQQVDKLKNQVNNMEAALSTCTSTTGTGLPHISWNKERASLWIWDNFPDRQFTPSRPCTCSVAGQIRSHYTQSVSRWSSPSAGMVPTTGSSLYLHLSAVG
uniref:Uncharacterized protein n=1 Tax=Monopterus albus TaxID=43700 RepID=A0A3Q3R6Y7_MONAL